MTQRRSNSYEQLEQALSDFSPQEPTTTHMVINGNQVAAGPTAAHAAVLRELAQLSEGAVTFKVLLTTVYDEVENVALVAFNGEAKHVAELVAFMARKQSATRAR